MLLERIYDEDLAQASYLIGCQATGEALVVDPRRDVRQYLELAAHHGMRITTVAETHIHADFLSGTRELAAATGATAYISGEGGADWQYGFEAQRLHEGDTIALGNITITARHTPGHTPEHLSYLVTDGAFTDEPGYYLTGDFVFSGDVGRPDLLDEAAGGQDTRFAGAKDLFASLKNAFLTLPDHVQVYPGHGAGSACGKALGALPSTTVGYERKFAWWAKYLTQDDEQGFIDELLDGQPDAHAYFARMKRQNKQGPALLGELSPLQRLDTTEIAEGLAAGSLAFVDTRSPDEVHRGTVTGALNIPGAKAATYGAWSYDPEAENTPLVLLAPDAEAAEEIRDHLVRVGVDAVAGYTPTLYGLPTTVPARVTPAELESFLTEHQDAVLVDVRNRTEHAEGHVPDSVQLNAGKVLFHPDELPAKDAGPLVTYCQSGVRNAVAAAALRRAGYDVVELEGSYAAWSAWNAQQNTPQTETAGAA
ncbi:MBL fold metallo-hydrolase [Brevibacterium jeotgali]|uniref:Hydroxyacylglutathione hydrolase n=1 Tax=Brevibacterium jeotgali TaxID=1262550 RepID=A0A2H1L567_9MICO|nr:MBL fold metallo-hydrolase [Brevibacterium jeotgali]TWB98497.1 hydroxyacylglutathione hydrolase [Brevibacterium jeotgali]SMY12051.1 hydroxyacylglutathione hydrolase [Brevibacterium jeotgali]